MNYLSLIQRLRYHNNRYLSMITENVLRCKRDIPSSVFSITHQV